MKNVRGWLRWLAIVDAPGECELRLFGWWTKGLQIADFALEMRSADIVALSVARLQRDTTRFPAPANHHSKCAPGLSANIRHSNECKAEIVKLRAAPSRLAHADNVTMESTIPFWSDPFVCPTYLVLRFHRTLSAASMQRTLQQAAMQYALV